MADIEDITHLLRRTEYIARPARVTALSALTLEAAVEDVLNFAANPALTLPPGLLYDTGIGGPRGQQHIDMHDWWLDLMATRPRPFQEKMTFFWHGHFTTEWAPILRTDLFMRQIDLYRTMALGNFHDLAQAMSIDPQMLKYLSGENNTKTRPNENFGRELLELFLLGVGNYTQDDVAACSRAWTGHNLRTNPVTYAPEYVFNASNHDASMKTLFGVTRAWDGPDVIRFILRENADKQLVAARMVVRKLWEALAYASPATSVVDDLAATFITAQFELKPLLKALLLHPLFYSTQAKQGMLRSPVEWIVALLATTGITSKNAGAYNTSINMGQRALDPPNVAGWKHNAYYLTTGALGTRAQFARSLAPKIAATGVFTGKIDATTTPLAAVTAVSEVLNVSFSTVTTTAMVTAYTDAKTKRVAQATVLNNLVSMALLSGEMNAPS
ncbi:MAG: DUF1800 family protein [Ilumatobacteraceae bacterium]